MYAATAFAIKFKSSEWTNFSEKFEFYGEAWLLKAIYTISGLNQNNFYNHLSFKRKYILPQAYSTAV